MKLTALSAQFEKEGIGLAAISVDTVSDSAAFAAEESLNIKLLSDPQMKVTSAYGVAMEGRDISVPSVFIVDQQRQIRWRYVGEDMADRPDAPQILELAKSLRK